MIYMLINIQLWLGCQNGVLKKLSDNQQDLGCRTVPKTLMV